MTIEERLEALEEEKRLYNTLRETYEYLGGFVGLRTDFVYAEFCRRYDGVSRGQFGRLVCKAYELRSVQTYINGKRCSVYERR